MPYTWDLKEMAFVSNLGFPIETSPWTFGNDNGERKWAGVRALCPVCECRDKDHGWARLASNVLTLAWGVLFADQAESQAVSAEGRGGEGCPQLDRVAARPSAGQWLFRRVGVQSDCGNQSCSHFRWLLQPPCFQWSSSKMYVLTVKGRLCCPFLSL